MSATVNDEFFRNKLSEKRRNMFSPGILESDRIPAVKYLKWSRCLLSGGSYLTISVHNTRSITSFTNTLGAPLVLTP